MKQKHFIFSNKNNYFLKSYNLSVHYVSKIVFIFYIILLFNLCIWIISFNLYLSPEKV